MLAYGANLGCSTTDRTVESVKTSSVSSLHQCVGITLTSLAILTVAVLVILRLVDLLN